MRLISAKPVVRIYLGPSLHLLREERWLSGLKHQFAKLTYPSMKDIVGSNPILSVKLITGEGGFEPPANGFGGHRSTNWTILPKIRGDGIWTHDLLFPKQMRCRCATPRSQTLPIKLAEEGLEPTPYRLWFYRSNQTELFRLRAKKGFKPCQLNDFYL